MKGIRCLAGAGEQVYNYAYFPILVQPEYPLSRDELFNRMREKGVYARRYFYPLISEFPMYHGLPSAARANLPLAYRAAQQVICLPIYPDLADEDVDFVIEVIAGAEA